MRTIFEKGEKSKVIVLSEARKEANSWGKRINKQLPISYNNNWSLVWYPPQAWSCPHYHEKCESVYYFDFQGKPGKIMIYLGWPLSEATVKEITGPTLVYVPAFEVHTFVNCGETEMFLLHTFSPPFQDFGITIDTVDPESGKRFINSEEYTEHVREADRKYGTLDGYIEYLKKAGKY